MTPTQLLEARREITRLREELAIEMRANPYTDRWSAESQRRIGDA